MARSVSIPREAELVTYHSVEYETDEYSADWELAMFEETIRYFYADISPKGWASEKWLGDEDKALWENRLIYMGISVYGNVASLWVVPKEENRNLAMAYIERIKDKFLQLGNLYKVGTFSNGEAIFQKKQ